MKNLTKVASIIVLAGFFAVLASQPALAGVIGSDGRNNSESIGVIGSDGSVQVESIGVIGSDGQGSVQAKGVIGSDGQGNLRNAGVIGSDVNTYGVIGSDGRGVWSIALTFSPRLASLFMGFGLN